MEGDNIYNSSCKDQGCTKNKLPPNTLNDNCLTGTAKGA